MAKTVPRSTLPREEEVEVEDNVSPVASTSLQTLDGSVARPSSEIWRRHSDLVDPFKDPPQARAGAPAAPPPPLPSRSADRAASGLVPVGINQKSRNSGRRRSCVVTAGTATTDGSVTTDGSDAASSSRSVDAESLFPIATPPAPGTSASRSFRSSTFISLTSSHGGRRSHESQSREQQQRQHRQQETEEGSPQHQHHSQHQDQQSPEMQRHSLFIEDLPEFQPYHLVYPSTPHRRQLRSPTAAAANLTRRRRSNATPPRTPSKPHQQHQHSAKGEKGFSEATPSRQRTRGSHRRYTWKSWLLGSCIGTPTSGRSPRQTPTSSPAGSPPLGSPVRLQAPPQARSHERSTLHFAASTNIHGSTHAPTVNASVFRSQDAGIARRPSKLKKRPPETIGVPASLSRRGSTYGEWRRSMIDQVSADVSRRSSQRSRRSTVSRKTSTRSNNTTLAITSTSGSPASAAATRRRLAKHVSQEQQSQRTSQGQQQHQQAQQQQHHRQKQRHRWYKRILGLFTCSARKAHLD